MVLGGPGRCQEVLGGPDKGLEIAATHTLVFLGFPRISKVFLIFTKLFTMIL